ncbi:hypothetical protein PR003_g13436 [Phytophthora rubi]|uniref:Uncharacterized protein n=1 Tax=Phytophthora rubi TaxID=129364 RepID=A0A6A4F6L4_9STRA|nr:hypothetical protein PR002_g18154 [Phytophthora rubi]KAE9024170.1 hypothetical protein PR001_g12739 [Phytophthora rubi]KAE9334605.1 hypothetical protein PR003_g13436 [Phytophthora rubi]
MPVDSRSSDAAELLVIIPCLVLLSPVIAFIDVVAEPYSCTIASKVAPATLLKLLSQH